LTALEQLERRKQKKKGRERKKDGVRERERERLTSVKNKSHLQKRKRVDDGRQQTYLE